MYNPFIRHSGESRNPVKLYLVPDFRRDDVWMTIRVPSRDLQVIRVFIGMTIMRHTPHI